MVSGAFIRKYSILILSLGLIASHCSRTLIYLCNLVWNWKSVSLFLILGVIFLFLGQILETAANLAFCLFASFPLVQRNAALSLNPLEAQKWYPSHSREWGTPPFKKLIINFELNSLKGNDYFLRRSQSTILSCIAWLSIDSMVQKTYDFTDLSGDWRWSITILSLSTTSSTILPETSISWITVLSFILILS